MHAVGCRKFFNITRHTVSYEILETYRMGEQPRYTAEHPEGRPAEPAVAAEVSRQEGVNA